MAGKDKKQEKEVDLGSLQDAVDTIMSTLDKLSSDVAALKEAPKGKGGVDPRVDGLVRDVSRLKKKVKLPPQ